MKHIVHLKRIKGLKWIETWFFAGNFFEQWIFWNCSSFEIRKCVNILTQKLTRRKIMNGILTQCRTLRSNLDFQIALIFLADWSVFLLYQTQFVVQSRSIRHCLLSNVGFKSTTWDCNRQQFLYQFGTNLSEWKSIFRGDFIKNPADHKIWQIYSVPHHSQGSKLQIEMGNPAVVFFCSVEQQQKLEQLKKRRVQEK